VKALTRREHGVLGDNAIASGCRPRGLSLTSKLWAFIAIDFKLSKKTKVWVNQIAKRGETVMKYILLLIPCLLAIATPYYNTVEPTVLGFPFIFAYLLGLVPVSSVFIYLSSKV
jgi:hypothetical protein